MPQQQLTQQSSNELFISNHLQHHQTTSSNNQLQHQKQQVKPQRLIKPKSSNNLSTKRKKVAKACLFCKRSHMTCDDQRPCQRCIKREIGHLCCDDPPNQKLKDQHQRLIQMSPSQMEVLTPNQLQSNQQQGLVRSDIDPSISGLLPHLNHHQPQQQQQSMTVNPSGNLKSSSIDSLSSTPPVPQQIDLYSAFLPNQQHYNNDNILDLLNQSSSPQLNNGLRNISSPSFMNSSTNSNINLNQEEPTLDFEELLNSYPSLFGDSTSNSSQHQHFLGGGTINPLAMAQPLNQIKQEDSEDDGLEKRAVGHGCELNGYRQMLIKSESRLESLIREGGISFFDYSKSEALMIEWAEKMASSDPSRTRLINLFNESKSLFSAITDHHQMKEKIESEYQFKKNLIEYLPLLDNLPIAGCIWRRTGEIERFNPQFEELVDLKYYLQDHQSSSTHRFQQQQELIDDDVGNYDHQQGFCCSDKRVGGRSRLEGFKIYELWDEDSNLNYWEKFNKIALDPGQKAVLTSCVLLRKDIKRLRRRTNRRRQVKGENCEGISELKRIESEIKALDNNSKTKEGGEEEREDVEGGGFDDGRGSENVEFVNCTFSFTIKRDLFGLPCLIIGNFLS